jgi:transposase-like protein
VRQGEGVAGQVLAALGADLDGARERVVQVLAEFQARKAGS